MTYWLVAPQADSTPVDVPSAFNEYDVSEAARMFPEFIYFTDEETALEDSLENLLHNNLAQINQQIQQVEFLAKEFGCSVYEVRNTDGSFTLTPLLVGKAQVLAALVTLGKQ